MEFVQFLCVDCGDNTFMDEYYMVKDSVWETEAKMDSEGGMLCIGCLEDRIERLLVPSDFTDCPVNNDDRTFRKSKNLLNRLGR